MINQTIKTGDYVYFPTQTDRALQVQQEDGILLVEGELYKSFYPNGCEYSDDINPTIFLATQENKERLEAFYRMSLQPVPVDYESEFKDKLNQFEQAIRDNKPNNLKHELIKLFKKVS